jgi:hypothetical protein
MILDLQEEIALVCAAGGMADFASGDLHLLCLAEYRGMPVITARAFLIGVGELSPQPLSVN